MLPRSNGSSPKFHVVETFTGTWCPPCANADPALSRLTDEYHSNAMFLFYHCCTSNPASGNYDPYYNAVYDNRRNFYVSGGFGIPTVIFDGGGEYTDGTLVDVGSGASAASYDMYNQELEDWVDSSSNMVVSISPDMTPSAIDVTVSVTATDPVPQTNLYVRTIVYEENLYYLGTNGAPFHRNVARDINEQTISISQGQTVTVSTSFAIPPGSNLNKIGVAALVQSNTKRTVTSSGYTFTISDIINAAKADLVPRGILLHRDQGTTANYQEIYEKVASNIDAGFETWNVHVLGADTGALDDRQTPDVATLAEFPLVVWYTGGQTSGTLTSAERTLVGTHLDGGGSLLLTGSGIGFDGWTQYRAWFQQYLHAVYESDDTGASYVNGVAGDPISDSFSAIDLNIIPSPSGSPDRINAMAQPGVSVPFRYPAPSSFPAGVRAGHDADSRVVYLGFQYFENTVDANRGAVMTKILDWIDGAAAPQVDILSPDGGEQFDQGAAVDIRWHANDVRVPADGVDIYFSPDYPSAPWQLLAGGQPNDGVYRWTVPNIDSASCRVRVVVRDSSPESADGVALSQSDFTCGSVPYFELTFTSGNLGWHLISHPMVVADSSVTTVLNTIAGSYNAVRWFDANDPADPWKAYVPSKGGNDLLYVDNTIGFWIEITQPCSLQVVGSRPTSTTYVPLKAGWNLVGFPSASVTYTVQQLQFDTGATRVEAFDPTAGPYYLTALSPTATLRSGNGYWVYVPADTLWMVAPS